MSERKHSHSTEATDTPSEISQEGRHASKSEAGIRGGIKRGGLFLLIIAILCVAIYVASLVFSSGANPIKNLVESNLSEESATVGVAQIPDSLDVFTTSDDAREQLLVGNVYEGLTSRDNDNKAAAGLAASWDVSKDALTYTFHLQSDEKFSNGDALTSEDVVWSLQQTLEKKHTGYDQLKNLSGVSAIDDTTVEITLSSPNPNLLWVLGGRAGLVYDKTANVDAQTSAIGSGPFTVKAFEAGKSMTLARNGTYWGEKSRLAQVRLKAYGTSDEALQAAQKGEIQGVIGLTAAQVNAVTADKETPLTVVTGDTTTRVVLVFNSDASSILSDKRYRQALRMGLDRDQVISASGHLGEKIGGPIPLLDPGYEDLTGLFPTNVAESVRTRSYFRTRNLTLVYPSTISDAIAQSVASQYQAEGLQITVTKLSPEEWEQQVKEQHSFDLTLDIHSASHNVEEWFNGQNWWTFDSPAADALYQEAMGATTDAEYQEKLSQAAKVLSQEAPADWIYTEKISAAWGNDMSGMPTNMLNTHLPLAGLEKK
jgi:peptide/nickel transport system substrate-binding protein